MNTQYHLIDLNEWPRREHFAYYRDQLKCGYSLTGRVDVTELVRYARTHDLRKYGCFLYVISRTVNSMESMRLMVDGEGNPGLWEVVHPNFTVFHQEDETFSDLWTEYHAEFSKFYQGWLDTMDRYGDVRGVKGRGDQPPNFFCASCVPWMDFTGYATHSEGPPALFPIIAFGKYTEAEGRWSMPVTITVSHAAADGYHSSLFFKKLREELEQFSGFAEC